MPVHNSASATTPGISWSTHGQTPEFLAATRMISLSDRIVSAIQEQLRIEAGMSVLDAGCGSGEYCFRLGSHVNGARFTGFDNDKHFVDVANARARGKVGYPFELPNPANEYRFMQADGCSLPFQDEAFDVVVSHTYLTAIPRWEDALREMCRVCATGGTVSSVTSLTGDFFGTGTLELLAGPLNPDDEALASRVRALKERWLFGVNLVGGIEPHLAPSAFAQVGLEEVTCTPLAHYFCLSDANVSPAESMRYIDLLRAVEDDELARLHAIPEAMACMNASDWQRYERLVEQRYLQLVASVGNNAEWNWYGNASLLVVGKKRMPVG